jgi:hypothetical protein
MVLSSVNGENGRNEADLDTILEKIQPPSELLAALKPSPSRTISDFLQIRQPPRPGSRKYFLDPSLWFSAETPNCTFESIDSLILPSERLCEILDSYLPDAVRNGMQSVQHPVKKQVFLPFWTVRAWKWGNVLVKKQSAWRAHLEWVRETAAEEGWPAEMRERVIADVKSIPWHMGYNSLQNGMVSTTTLAGLLSDEWVNDEQIDCIGDVIRADMQTFGVNASTQLAPSCLGKNLEIPGMGSTERFFGRRLQTGEVKNLVLKYNVKNLHWISIEIDVAERILNFGDSKPGVTERVLPILPSIRSLITKWLDHYLPNISWTVNLKGIKVPLQLDAKSCGIAAPNGIHHRLIPIVPLWDPKKPGKMRAYFFCRCVALGKGVCVSAF